MIVVDTSVWVELLNGTPSREADVLRELVEREENIALTAVIFAGILQGPGSDEEADLCGKSSEASRSPHWTD